MAITTAEKGAIISEYRRSETDTGSPEVQVAVLTERIRQLGDHLQGHPKDNHNRRGLILMVARRNRLLKYLARTNPEGYRELIGRLGLRR